MADKEPDVPNGKFIVIIEEDLQDLVPGYLENDAGTLRKFSTR